LQSVANRATRIVEIDLDDVYAHEGDEQFVAEIQRNTLRYVKIFSEVADSLMPKPTVDLTAEGLEDVQDVCSASALVTFICVLFCVAPSLVRVLL
jgi:DNA replication licensing factor MCM7